MEYISYIYIYIYIYILTIYIGANENNNKHNGKTIPPNNKYQSQSTGRTVVSKSIGLIKYAMKPTIHTTMPLPTCNDNKRSHLSKLGFALECSRPIAQNNAHDIGLINAMMFPNVYVGSKFTSPMTIIATLIKPKMIITIVRIGVRSFKQNVSNKAQKHGDVLISNATLLTRVNNNATKIATL